MNELMVGVLAGALWDAIKKGTAVTSTYLKEKLRGWIMDGTELDRLETYVNEIPDAYFKSAGMIEEYIKQDNRILDILSSLKPERIQNINNTAADNGIIIDKNFGPVQNIKIDHYAASERPRMTNDGKLSLSKGHSKFNPVPVVMSYSSTRAECIIDNDSVCADIYIPDEVKTREGCQFAMICFSFFPSENWVNYYDEGYRLSFRLDLSDSIKKIQLQIKDTHQQQFIDLAVNAGDFSYLLSEMVSRDTWKDVREICFTVFADDSYIDGERGTVKIIDLSLSR